MKYYADLNPRYGAKYEKRWAIFIRRSPTDSKQTTLQYVTRKAAENNAAKLTAMEVDPFYPDDGVE